MAVTTILDFVGNKIWHAGCEVSSLQVLVKFCVDSSNGLEVMTHKKTKMAAGSHLGFCSIGPHFKLAKVPLTVNPHTKFQRYLSIFG
jgi:hypothetical protein